MTARMLPHGAFVVLRVNSAPSVELLGAGEFALYMDRGRVVGSDKARVATFGTDSVAILPAHSLECMREIAESYLGAYQTEVRGLCAAIALGMPTNDAPDYSEARRDPGDGGRTVDRPIPPPRKPTPTGASFKPQAALAELLAN